MLLYQAAHKARFNWIELVVCTKTWKLMNRSLQCNSDSDWHDDKNKRIVWKTVVMSSSKEEKRAISDAEKFVLQVLSTYGCKISFGPREQVAEQVEEIKFFKDGNRSLDFINVSGEVFKECEHAVHIHPTETEMSSEVQHWSSVGRVSEIEEDTGTESRAVGYPILSGYSVYWVYIPEHVNFEVNLFTKTGGTVDRFQV